MAKPILLVDFDGVIHSYSSGWKGAGNIPDAPVPGALGFLVGASKLFRINIYSARTSQEGGLEAMQQWCLDNFGEAVTAELYFPKQKPAAFLTIDDRCVRFDGTFPDIQTLREFKPWNKKEV